MRLSHIALLVSAALITFAGVPSASAHEGQTAPVGPVGAHLSVNGAQGVLTLLGAEGALFDVFNAHGEHVGSGVVPADCHTSPVTGLCPQGAGFAPVTLVIDGMAHELSSDDEYCWM